MNRRKVTAVVGALALTAGGSLGHALLDSDGSTEVAATTTTTTTTTTPPPTSSATTSPPTESTVPFVRASAAAALDYVDALIRFDDEAAYGLLCPERRDALDLASFSGSLREGRLRLGMRLASVRDVIEHVDAVTVLVDIGYDVMTTTHVKVLVVPTVGSHVAVVCDVHGPDQALDMVWPPSFRDA